METQEMRQVTAQAGPASAVAMASSRDILSLLRESGLRITPQRLMILEILQQSSRHLSVDEIIGEIQTRFPSIEVSTVYRTLDVLRSLGLVQKTSLGESHAHFEWIAEPHAHAICRSCGSIVRLEDDALHHLRTVLATQHQFQIDGTDLEVFGTCARCAEGPSATMAEPDLTHQH
jgi:Fe2+ or Zn2+ uptake regulation protein